MTNEEAIAIIKSECYVMNLLNIDRTQMINKALDKAIEALEQQPCEDCISRSEAIRQFISWASDTDDTHAEVVDFSDILEYLPSIKPQNYKNLRCKGKWICLTPQQWQDGRTATAWMCSECKEAVRFIAVDLPYKICPNCGADMRGEVDTEN